MLPSDGKCIPSVVLQKYKTIFLKQLIKNLRADRWLSL